MQVFTDNTPAREYFKAGSGIVTLCGSTKFFKECMDANRWLTFNNWMVLACGSWGHSYHKGEAVDADHDYDTVKNLHFYKLLQSDCALVVADGSGYIGASTKGEIAFCIQNMIPVWYANGCEFTQDVPTHPHTPPNRFENLKRYDSSIQRLRSYYGG